MIEFVNPSRSSIRLHQSSLDELFAESEFVSPNMGNEIENEDDVDFSKTLSFQSFKSWRRRRQRRQGPFAGTVRPPKARRKIVSHSTHERLGKSSYVTEV